MFRTSNPTMKEKFFTRDAAYSGPAMTLRGTIGKSFLLFAILLVSAVAGWQMANIVVAIGTALLGLGLAVVISFKRDWSPVLAPVYAIVEGVFVGAISSWYATAFAKGPYPTIVPMAVLATLGVFGIMLALYGTRVIKVTETFKMVVIGATLAIMATYLLSWGLSLFIPAVWNMPIYGSGLIGIAFSVIVIIIAALNFALDFNLVEEGVKSGAPKYMEWFAGFALLVTLVWLYLEVLRLFSKLQSR